MCEIDDPKDILKSMLTPDVLNTFNNNSVPPHELCLAGGDNCLMLRNLSNKDVLANNARVRSVIYSSNCCCLSEVPNLLQCSSQNFKYGFSEFIC